jgi:hypothetical protein
MSVAERSDAKIPTKNPQAASAGPGRGRASAGPGRAGVRRRRGAAGAAAAPVSSAVPVGWEPIVTEQGITVYPARSEGGRWRATWYEPDGSRGQCQSVSEHGLAVKLEKVTERLTADVPNMLRSGSELIGYYLSDDRRPAQRAWSRKHADTQRDLCARYLEPVIGHLASQDIRVADMQAVVNAAPTAKEGKRVRAMSSRHLLSLATAWARIPVPLPPGAATTLTPGHRPLVTTVPLPPWPVQLVELPIFSRRWPCVLKRRARRSVRRL